jgi:hypothetical protein
MTGRDSHDDFCSPDDNSPRCGSAGRTVPIQDVLTYPRPGEPRTQAGRAGLLVAAALLATAQALGLPGFILLPADRLSPGGRTGAGAAVTAGYDIGYGAAAPGLGSVADRAGYPAMFLAAALVTVAGAALALRIVDSSQPDLHHARLAAR